ncbi:hypothetical protein AAIH00_36040, partial [Pseudomonas aeruginosa]
PPFCPLMNFTEEPEDVCFVITIAAGQERLAQTICQSPYYEIGLLVVIAILYLVFSLNAPGFISLNNQMNVLRDAATIGIAAWAMTLIIISGEIDVSVGPMVAFVSV